MYRSALLLAVFATPSVNSGAQSRRATLVGGGAPDRGKCTIEVVVDGTADVEIRGDQGVLRNLAGGAPQWRRFECTAPLPARPAEFRFAGVDGRGRQDLVRDPRNGGAAVVRIEDREGGAEGYTFDLFWGGYSAPNGFPNNPPGRPQIAGRPGSVKGYTTDQAVRVCQDSVRQEARQRFGSRNVEFLDGRLDDSPGRNDWILGRIQMRGGQAPREVMRYSCSVDFNSGRVRSAAIDPIDGGGFGGRGGGGANRAFETCQRAVEERVRRDGFGRVEFTGTRTDDQPGRNDWVLGSVRAYRGPNFESFEFSCSVDLRSGEVRSVDVRRR
jgi:hypothetical protein